MFSQINGIGLFGMNAFAVTAEISTKSGSMPSFDIVGLPDAAVQESKLRIHSALENSGITLKSQRTVINLAPANVKKTGSIYDLPILVAVLSTAVGFSKDLSRSAFIGELSLSGNVNHADGALTMAIAAKENGIDTLYLPEDNAAEASVVEGLTVYGVKNVAQLVAHLTGENALTPVSKYIPLQTAADGLLDFADVKGQENVKAALEVAAAGFHNVLMIGPPGTGKSMLAKRLPSILPPMNFSESIETTQIHSVAGILDRNAPLVTVRPFRDVSHTASSVGLIGGGSIPRPGEISLAHNGVLFLDELPEFDRKVLETLRQPLENREITISRAQGSVTYPCNIMLIAAMNPCPCGNFGSQRKCTCSERQVTAYLGKISQPVLDRIDIQVEVNAVEFNKLNDAKRGEPSDEVRKRVINARLIQQERFKGTGITSNSSITPKYLHEFCRLDKGAEDLVKSAFDRLGLSARAYDRILKVSRTIADLYESKDISKSHISRAIQYRSLDRKYWNR